MDEEQPTKRKRGRPRKHKPEESSSEAQEAPKTAAAPDPAPPAPAPVPAPSTAPDHSVYSVAKGANVLLGSKRRFLGQGSLVSQQTHDIDSLRRQGVELREV